MAEAKAYKMIPHCTKDTIIYEMDELVRCKNCKYHYVDGDNVRYNMCLLLHNKAQPDDWFCADGERKE